MILVPGLRRLVRRLPAVVVISGAALLVGPASPAAADPPGPTDYKTEVVAVDPLAADRIEVGIVGGDSFVEMTLLQPATDRVEVVGYRGEPYLRFEPDGDVFRNDRSPTRWLNEQRDGAVPVPDGATADAEPSWRRVASDGSYAWHDHRAHWMGTDHPPGARPGDIVLEAEIPLLVAGDPAGVRVRSVLLDPPSRLAPVLGMLAGLVTVAVAAVVGRRGRSLAAGAVAATVWALLALGHGLAAFLAVPAVTGPSRLWWLLPAVAAAAGTAAAVTGWRWPLTHPRRHVPLLLLVLAGAELAAWSWIRREVLVRSLIPTVAPEELDRMVVAGALVVAGGTVVAAVARAVRATPGSRTAATMERNVRRAVGRQRPTSGPPAAAVAPNGR